MFEPFTELPTAALKALAASLRQGVLARGSSDAALHQIAGPLAASVSICLDGLASEGMTPTQAALIIEAVLAERVNAADLASLFDVVLSGPEVAGAPTADTGAAIVGLIQEAQREIVLVTYVLHNTEQIFGEVVQRLNQCPNIAVKLFVHIARPAGDTSLPSEIVRRFAADFRKRHWPWENPPYVYFDPRGLAPSAAERASLHAKCVVVDRCSALITSANFTEAARTKNIELGLVTRHPPIAKRIAEHFDALVAAGSLDRCAII
jgi:phosphatidylserine/phosphatidylglycerophosphate/cardiolipin synthase-like enzyme